MSEYEPPPAHLGNLTPEQEKTLEQFRKELTKEGWIVEARHDDATLLRFLRARKFDIVKAKEMFIAAEKWRQEFKVEYLKKNFRFTERAAVNNLYPQYYHKTDKDGRPIYIEQLGKLNVHELYLITQKERLLQRLVLEYEGFLTDRLPASSRMMGRPVETSCTIMDLNKVSLWDFYKVKDYVMEAARISQDYYPECMGKFYIINAPYLFSTVWAIIRPLLDEVTANKIQFMSTGHRDVLLEQIPPENLPVEFGGLCTCDGLGGCSLSNAGPWIKPTETVTATAPAPAPALSVA